VKKTQIEIWNLPELKLKVISRNSKLDHWIKLT